MRHAPQISPRTGRLQTRAGTSCEPVRLAPPCRACAELDPVTACEPCISQAARLYADGMSCTAIAGRMSIKAVRAAYLVAIAHDRELRERLSVDAVATADLRALVAAGDTNA